MAILPQNSGFEQALTICSLGPISAKTHFLKDMQLVFEQSSNLKLLVASLPRVLPLAKQRQFWLFLAIFTPPV